MKLLKLVPDQTNIKFIRLRWLAFALSTLLIVASIALFFARGLNYGIDFEGGILIEIKTEQAVDLGALRTALNGLGLGAVQIQQFGEPEDVLIRVQRQEGDASAQEAAVNLVKAKLSDIISGEISYRRVEFVGPKVSGELVRDGILSVTLALVAVLLYIWVRFEWQFGLGAVIALFHDVVITIGMFAITQLEFNLSIIAALLTIVGYSLNDTVVVYDRIRENLLKFRKMPIDELLDLSVNDTLSRTVTTSFTTLLALFALFIFGGEVIRGFTAAMIWGIFIGTYSSIFVAAPILLLINPREQGGEGASAVEGEPEKV
ncbi:MAG: protein translocase subunit SecF [Alphaproteobacteria bacterium]|nr:MAG: protein translocase subunit SecF [Alphaproteobacteria bacterium]